MISKELTINFPDCFKPDWCRTPFCLFVEGSPVCVSKSLFEQQTKVILRLEELAKIGKIKSSEELIYKMSKIYHLVYFLILVEFQLSLGYEDIVEDYLTCDEVKCFVEEYLCIGCDIECILDCFSILKSCGYGKDCDNCTTNFVNPAFVRGGTGGAGAPAQLPDFI